VREQQVQEVHGRLLAGLKAGQELLEPLGLVVAQSLEVRLGPGEAVA
jgi:hypothetical protein